MAFEEAAKSFHKAMKGFGTDESRIIKEICSFTNQQRQEIKIKYKTMYGHDLEEDLKSEISGNFLQAVIGLLTPRVEYEATCLRNAMQGLGTKESVLIELLCSKDPYEIEILKDTYARIFQRNLESDIESETSGDLGRILRSLVTCARQRSQVVDQNLAVKEAQELYDAGQGTTGTDEIEFVRIFCTRSFIQLRATFEAYYQICQCDIQKAIKKEMSGDVENAFLAIIKCIRNKSGYFAELLNNAMKGMGTKDNDLIRILVSRSEVDLNEIKQEYKRMYGKSLYDVVKSELSGDYEKLFLNIIGKD